MNAPRTACRAPPEPAPDAAGLVHVTDAMPGITRRRRGRGFSYHQPDGALLRDEATLARVRSLAVPPAYREVWICPLPRGHLQATGRDDRGRKQYIYHPDYRALCEQTKFDGLIDFAEALPALRERVRHDLARRSLRREKVLAVAARLLERTLIRVGNRSYERSNDSRGLTTLGAENVEVGEKALRLVFRGKRGQERRLRLHDRRVATALRRLEDIPGQHLFCWRDGDGTLHEATSTDVNAYIREATGGDWTAKSFRTWGGTVLMGRALNRAEPPQSKTAANRAVVAAADEVAEALGNTRAVCRRSYVHPALPEAYAEGRLAGRIDDPCPEALPFPDEGLGRLERSVLDLLRQERARKGA